MFDRENQGAWTAKFQNRRSQQQQQNRRKTSGRGPRGKTSQKQPRIQPTIMWRLRAENEQGIIGNGYRRRRRIRRPWQCGEPEPRGAHKKLGGARLESFHPVVFLSTTRVSYSPLPAGAGFLIGAACSCHRARRRASPSPVRHPHAWRPAGRVTFVLHALDSSSQLIHRQCTIETEIEIRLPDNFVDYLQLGRIARSPMQCKW
jgi:hypothetical protein